MDRCAGGALSRRHTAWYEALNGRIDLPGRLEAYSRAPIFARVSGYLKNWYVDLGAPVKAGQTLAEIDAPDLDQQLMQARADLANAQAAAKLSAATLSRRKTLLAANFVSQQEIDERSADLASKEAQVRSMQANVERLEALASYKTVTAPFDGIVTERNTDVGALINGGTGSGAAMFVISDARKLRLYVNVPQSLSAFDQDRCESCCLLCPNTLAVLSRRWLRLPHNRLTLRPARRACSWFWTMRLGNCGPVLTPMSSST